MSALARVLCLVLAVATCPRPVEASGEKGAPAEQKEMADWQAASPNAALFEGGESVLGVIIAILIIVLLVYLIIELSHNHSMSSPLDGAAAAAPPPALFR